MVTELKDRQRGRGTSWDMDIYLDDPQRDKNDKLSTFINLRPSRDPKLECSGNRTMTSILFPYFLCQIIIQRTIATQTLGEHDWSSLAGAGDPVHDVRSAGVPLDAALVPARRGPLLRRHGLLHSLLHVPRHLSQELGSQLATNGEYIDWSLPSSFVTILRSTRDMF